MAFLIPLCLCLFEVLTENILTSIDLPNNGISPEPRTNPSIATDSLGNFIYLFGGRNKHYFLNDLWVFDIRKSIWSIIYAQSAWPEPRSNSGSFFRTKTKEFCIYSGYSDAYPFSDLWCFSTTLNIWSKIEYPIFKFTSIAKIKYMEYFENEYLIFLSVDRLQNVTVYVLNMISEEFKTISFNESYTLRKFRNDGILEINRGKIVFGNFDDNGTSNYNIYSCDLELILCEIKTFQSFNKSSIGSIVESTLIDDSLLILTSSKILLNFCLFSDTFILTPQTNFQLSTNCGHSSYKNSIFIFGGISNKILDNSLTSIFISSNNSIISKILSKYQITPPLRLKSALVQIRDKLYLYGGQGLTSYLNDMLVYSPSLSKWSQVFYKGNSPSPRHSFAYSSIGDILIIWGGESESGYNNDLYIYNAVTNIWTEMLSLSIKKPNKRYGACMIIDLPYIYIGGGANELGICSDVWVYDLIKQKYTKTQFSVSEVYAYCYLDKKEIIHLSGEDKSLIDKMLYDRSYIGQMVWGQIVKKFSKGVVFIGGAVKPGTLNDDFVYNYENKDFFGKVMDLPCYSLSAFFGSSIYYFSGSYFTSKNNIFYSYPRAKFAHLDLKLMCDNHNCSFECSPGFVLHKSNCFLCPSGTYSDNNICFPCKKGFFNPFPGASSIRQCYPCPEGSFNDKEGSSKCKICPVGYSCYAGSTAPKTLNKKTISLQYSTTYLSLPTQKENYISKNLFYFVFCVLLIAFLGYFANDKVKILIIKIDLYRSSYNCKNGDKLCPKKNFTGAIFTIMLYISFIYIGSSMIFYYFIKNEYKEYSLIPLVLLDSISKNFEADFEIVVSIKNYADQCSFFNIKNFEDSNYSKCASSINVFADNLPRQKISIECMSYEDSCDIKIICLGCTVDKSSSINIELRSNFSYSSGYSVMFTSKSYISSNSQKSSLFEIYPKKEYVFIGPNPTIFTFLLTPSLLESLTSSELLVGYNSEEYLFPIEGSVKNVKDLFLQSELHIKIVLEKNTHGFLTRVYRSQSAFSLIGALFGVFTGLMTVFGFILQITEIVSAYSIKKQDINPFKRILQTRMNFVNAFKDVIGCSHDCNSAIFDDFSSLENKSLHSK
ncbi:hypothetical protein SteCoe_26261 [Stentor coeruleus]|uniref:Tyrosine-protein kinase ephrin type A/B receptor-like domain-containing protein n=1 Tax=Stentor coeruleus TaxID=5963 RepID=A0A1R2BDB2_9CILI|nr:hypothetical protein SteCoe_26261 [Stentor coeruleus]